MLKRIGPLFWSLGKRFISCEVNFRPNLRKTNSSLDSERLVRASSAGNLFEHRSASIPRGELYPSAQSLYLEVRPSYRCFQIRLPRGILAGEVPLQVRIRASTGTELIAYQGYGDTVQQRTAESAPVELNLGAMNKSLFHLFTTTLIEIILNREPLPFNTVSRILQFAP